jgi:integrase
MTAPRSRPAQTLGAVDAAERHVGVPSMWPRGRRALVLGMIFDHAGIKPNPARDRTAVKLPFERKMEIVPPVADHVRAVHDLLPARYRLPLLVLDATGMRLGELEGLTWADVGESRTRWRVSQAVSKTGRARWVNVAPVVFDAVMALVPREDRTPDRPVFQGFGGDRFRTAVTRACTAGGVPPSALTTSVTAASVSFTWTARHGRGSANTSANGTLLA